ncbi:MAG: Gfo/Idh/MocA family oxidoreductase [Verrucomicrobiota bacterium]|nr:Gfo/Idh/MocA family oxidoreductase [Verrucomicrobiota bacterium]
MIGLGVGEQHIQGFEGHAGCKVVSLCDMNPQVLKEVGRRFEGKVLYKDPKEILNDPKIDIVSIASYDDSHEEQIIGALRNGKHVFVEKPLCLTRNELEKIVHNLNKRPTLHLSSNLILRKVPRFMQLRERIRSGHFGETYHFEGCYDYGRLHKLTEGWRGKIHNYSVTHGGGIHLIDLILWLSGKKILTVHAVGNNIPTKSSHFKGPSLTSAVLKFEDGATAQVTSNYASVTPHHHKLTVYGTRCTFEQSHLGAAYFKSRCSDETPERVDSPYPGASKGDLLHNFVSSIRGEAQPSITKQEVIDAMSVSLAIDESIFQMKPVPVPYPQLS